MNLPLVSIVIPSYKASHFESCLRSAIGQTYKNIEILVSDNCPTEEIYNICKKFPNVIYQRSSVVKEKNVISAIYSGKGEFIKPLFDDDILHPFCVERMVNAMYLRNDLELVFSASQVIDINNERVEVRRPYEFSGFINGRDLHRSMALGLCNFVGEFSSILFKREKLWNIGWHDLFVIENHDFSLGLADVAAYCNLVKDGAAFYIDEELTYFRRDQRLQSNSNINFNSNFGFCFSDYIDLLVESHRAGIISNDELVSRNENVKSLHDKLSPIFHQVSTSFDRYCSYVDLSLG